jgi:hypothetical protein
VRGWGSGTVLVEQRGTVGELMVGGGGMAKVGQRR